MAAYKNEMSGVESVIRGLLQGVTFGFADELAGAVEAPFRQGDLVDAYRRGRDESRAKFEEAARANPKLYHTSDLVGSFLVPIPGSTAVRAASLGGKMAISAAQGGLRAGIKGMGESTGKTWGENLADTGRAADTGAVIGGLLAPVGRIANKIGAPVKGAGGKFVPSPNLFGARASQWIPFSEPISKTLKMGGREVMKLGNPETAGKVGAASNDAKEILRAYFEDRSAPRVVSPPPMTPAQPDDKVWDAPPED